MAYVDQMRQWLSSHPKATLKEAWEAGYLQCLKNWCNKKR